MLGYVQCFIKLSHPAPFPADFHNALFNGLNSGYYICRPVSFSNVQMAWNWRGTRRIVSGVKRLTFCPLDGDENHTHTPLTPCKPVRP